MRPFPRPLAAFAYLLFLISILTMSAMADKAVADKTARSTPQTIFRMKGDTIDFSGIIIDEPVNIDFWKRQIRKGLTGVEIAYADSLSQIEEVIIHSPIILNDTKIMASADFSRTHFGSSVDFYKTRFSSRTDFSQARFDSSADFTFAHFESATDFSEAQFGSEVIFYGTEFGSTAKFSWARFDSVANFQSVRFDSVADFRWARFFSKAIFSRTQFESEARFSWTRFESESYFNVIHFGSAVEFLGVRFDSGVTYSNSRFESSADFSLSQFIGECFFAQISLPDSIAFIYVDNIGHEIDLTNCLPNISGKNCFIALQGSDIDRIKLNMSLFSLSFPADTITQSFSKDAFTWNYGKNRTLSVMGDTLRGWPSKHDTIRTIFPTADHKASIYERVLNKLKNDGFVESYQILDIEYRKFKAEHEDWLTWYVGDTFQDWWWNYGYSPERIFLWSLFLWSAFSNINLWIYYKLKREIYDITFLDNWDLRGSFQSRKRLSYCLQVVTYTAIIFFGLKMNIEKFQKEALRNHPFLFSYLMVIYVIGLICLGFIVNIIFTK